MTKLCYLAGLHLDPPCDGILQELAYLLGDSYAPIVLPADLEHEDPVGTRTAYLRVTQECWCFYYEVPEDDVVMAAAQAAGMGVEVRWFSSDTWTETDPPVDLEKVTKAALTKLKPGSSGYDAAVDRLLGTAMEERDEAAERAFTESGEG